MSTLIFLVLVCAAVSAAASPASPDAAVVAALKLFTEYNSAVRPPPDDGLANTLNVYMFLNSIIKVDSTTQEIKLKVWLHVYWIDSRLAWKGRFNSSLDNISAIALPATYLWKPDANFYDVVEMTDNTEGRAIFSVTSSGVVLQSTGKTLTTKCSMQMQRFPFDEQNCFIRLSTLQQVTGVTRIRIKPFSDTDTPEMYIIKSSEFCIQWARLENGTFGSYDTAVLRIGFQRLPTFYIVNMMLPSVLLLAISAIAFRLPPECGERASFSITIVLSMCVFLQLAGNYTPSQSESVSLITWYFSLAVLMTMLNVLCNAFVLRCHFKQQSHVCNQLIRVLFLNRIVLGRSSQRKVAAADTESAESQPPNTSMSFSCFESEWKAVGASADRVFFTVFVSVGFAMLAVPLVMYLTSNNMSCVLGYEKTNGSSTR